MGHLYQQLYAWANLQDAWSKVRKKRKTKPGIDGIGVSDFEKNLEARLRQLQQELQQDNYQPDAVIRSQISQSGGKIRPVCILTIRDRLAQHAVLNILSPRLEKRFSHVSYAYRSGLSIMNAYARVQQARDQGYVWVLKTDIASFFDTLDHKLLKRQIQRFIHDEKIQVLLSKWIRARLIDAKDPQNVRTMNQGVPQGAVISPLLANLYLADFDQAMEQLPGILIRYADDMLVLCRSETEIEAVVRTLDAALKDLRLSLNPDKTYISHFSKGFQFLGAEFRQEAVKLPELLSQPKKAVKPAASPKPAPPPDATPLLRTLYLREQGSFLRLENQQFVISKDSKVLQKIPARLIDQIAVMGNCQISSHTMRHCLKEGVPVVYMSQSGHYFGQMEGPGMSNSQRHQLQFERLQNPAFTLATAWQLVNGKLINSQAFLQDCQRRFGVSLGSQLKAMRQLSAELARIDTLDQLMGYEGAAAVLHFEAIKGLVPADWGFVRRQRQPPPDPVNALLSLGYTHLFNNMFSLLRLHRLNPYVGYLHSLRNGHPALASDLIEEFRAVVVDHLVLGLIHHGQLKLSDFQPGRPGPGGQTGCYMTKVGLKTFTTHFEKRLQTVVLHPASGYKADFRRCMELQVIQFLHYLEGRLELYQPYHPANW